MPTKRSREAEAESAHEKAIQAVMRILLQKKVHKHEPDAREAAENIVNAYIQMQSELEGADQVFAWLLDSVSIEHAELAATIVAALKTALNPGSIAGFGYATVPSCALQASGDRSAASGASAAETAAGAGTESAYGTGPAVAWAEDWTSTAHWMAASARAGRDFTTVDESLGAIGRTSSLHATRRLAPLDQMLAPLNATAFNPQSDQRLSSQYGVEAEPWFGGSGEFNEAWSASRASGADDTSVDIAAGSGNGSHGPGSSALHAHPPTGIQLDAPEPDGTDIRLQRMTALMYNAYGLTQEHSLEAAYGIIRAHQSGGNYQGQLLAA